MVLGKVGHARRRERRLQDQWLALNALRPILGLAALALLHLLLCFACERRPRPRSEFDARGFSLVPTSTRRVLIDSN